MEVDAIPVVTPLCRVAESTPGTWLEVSPDVVGMRLDVLLNVGEDIPGEISGEVDAAAVGVPFHRFNEL